MVVESTPGEATATPRSGKPAAELPPIPVPADQQRFLRGHPVDMPAWSDELRAKIDPERDESVWEKVAVRTESGLAAFLEGLLGEELAGARSHLAEGFTGAVSLFPELDEVRFRDASYVVFEAQESTDARLSLDDLRGRLVKLGWLAAAERTITASVEGIEPRSEGVWSCALVLRFAGLVGGARQQMDVDLEAVVESTGEPGDSPRILELKGGRHRQVVRVAPGFEPISGHVFGALDFWDTEIALGCEDYLLMADRHQLSFGTGILGMALGDVNGDGLEDIYLSQIGGFPNRLLLHQADGTVVDGAPQAGVDFLDTTRGTLLIDLDGDDDLDLVFSRGPEMIVCWNDGQGRFTEQSLLDGPGHAQVYSLSAADPDNDGDLDLFANRYPLSSESGGVPIPYHDATNGAQNLYWRNLGGHEFELAGEETGLSSGEPRYSFVSLWEDFDGDGALDLYVVNDFGPNNLYINEGGHFVDRATEFGLVDYAAGMGISVADVEMDGDLDVYATNMFSAPGLRASHSPEYRQGDEKVRAMHQRFAAGNSLMLNDGTGHFTEHGAEAGVNHGGWAWGGIFYDWNTDGLPDVYLPNGFITSWNTVDVEGIFWRWVVRTTTPPETNLDTYMRNWGALSQFNQYKGFSYNGYERNHVYLNMGEGEFADISTVSEADFIDDGRVAARVDWDGDGREDLLLVNRTGPRLRLLRNVNGAPGHRIAIDLRGHHGGVGAIGARITVHRTDDKQVTRTIYAGEGLLGQSSTRQFFGLGQSTGPVDVEVRWPDGELQRFEKLAIDRRWVLHREGARTVSHDFVPSPFEGRGPAPVFASSEPVRRTVLTEKIPLRRWSLTHPAGGVRPISDLAGAPTLLTFWDPESAASHELLRRISKARRGIARAGTQFRAVQLGDPSRREDGLRQLAELGLDEGALWASEQETLVLETILIEVLNNYESIELPLSLLLDAEGNLCALYFGVIARPRLIRDLQRVRGMQADDLSTVALSGGRWLGWPRRRYRQAVRVLMSLGAIDLARDLQGR